ncbi:MAG: autotransporter outer membrane beta-barrel domain-containing protein [Kiritimatiellales bacterium]|nr:autotransporter outer membrane beta-barrel domain-containing protein [Kiritimatiellales bacterium]
MLRFMEQRGRLSAFLLICIVQAAQAATFENGLLSANGGNGSDGNTDDIIISGGNWIGTDGGIADESELLGTSPDAYVSQIHSSGGAGVYYTGASQFSVTSNATFTGGHAGQSIGISTNADAYSNGGQGASVSAPPHSYLINPFPGIINPQTPPFSGGSGVVITFTVFPTNLTIIGGDYFGGTGGNLTVVGGSGTSVYSPYTPITSGTFYGGSGGTASTGSSTVVIANGGNLTLTDSLIYDGTLIGGIVTSPSKYEISQGVFSGGNAGYAKSLKNAEAEGGAGLFLDNVNDISIGTITATAGNGGHAIGNEDIIARGGNGFAVHTSTNLVINGGGFLGGNGGTAQLSATNQSFYAMDASGGSGILGTSIQQTTLLNVVSKGGNGGTVDSGHTDLPTEHTSLLHADGGTGASFNNQNAFQIFPNPQRESEISLVRDSTFTGGNGGTISGGNIPASFWNNSPSARGGNGLDMYGYNPYGTQPNQLVLKNINAYGGDGGNILLTGGITNNSNSYIWKDASGGHGAEIQGYDDVTVDGGIYQGGKGGYIEQEKRTPMVLRDGSILIQPSLSGNTSGGYGMVVMADHATILDGTFQGGDSTLDPLRKNSGLYFFGKSLEIYNGNFNALEDANISQGLYAYAQDSLQIHGGNFNSMEIVGYYRTNETDFGFSELYISSNAVISGETVMSGNIRVPLFESGTFQNVTLTGGNFNFEDQLTLKSGAHFETDGVSTVLQMTKATLESGATMSIGDKAIFGELQVDDGATLVLKSVWSAWRSSGVMGLAHANQADVSANQAIFNIDSALAIDHQQGWIPAIGTTQQVASLTAIDLLITDGTNTHDMAQQDLDRISDSLNNYYLTTYDFSLFSSSTQQQIKVFASSCPLAGKTDNPLPGDLARFIDAYRTGASVSQELENKMDEMLFFLNNPATSKQFVDESRRYFNTAASPMVVSAVQAGQQAQLNQVLSHMDSFRQSGGIASSRPGPQGAAGPAEDQKGWSGWMKGYGIQATKDTAGDFTGYDANIAGAVIGVEKAFENSLIGVAGGQARTDVTTDEPGSSDMDTTFGSVYGSYGTKTWFIDSSLAYGHNQVTAKRGSLMPSQAKYDADNVSGYIGGGRQYRINGKMALTPDVGTQISYYRQEGFTETGVLSNSYDAYDYWSYQSILGASASMVFPAGDALLLQPELRLHWRHEFNADAGRISYITEGTGTGSSASIQSPEEDTLVIGAGLVATIKERVDIDLRIDQQLSKDWESTTYSGSLKVRF